MNQPARPGSPPPTRRDSEWAQAKVWDAVRRAALMGAAELQLRAAQLPSPRR